MSATINFAQDTNKTDGYRFVEFTRLLVNMSWMMMIIIITRKLSYRKDDRVMHPMGWVP